MCVCVYVCVNKWLYCDRGFNPHYPTHTGQCLYVTKSAVQVIGIQNIRTRRNLTSFHVNWSSKELMTDLKPHSYPVA